MNKKKFFCVAFISLIIITIGWNLWPYVFTTNNLISKNDFNYKYYQIDIIKLQDDEDHIAIKNDEYDKIDDFIKIIDELKLRKIKMPENIFHDLEYEISVIAAYKGKDDINYIKEVFKIYLYKNNVIGFQESPDHKEIFYKIQGDRSDIEEFIKGL